ncbi:MAG: hypothetical protein IKP40_11455 [Clostridia bacterium]|nr:hypothetical protein [Clostridia bacterium]
MDADTCFSVLDAVEILALATNIGQFRNTFAASQAAVRLCGASERYGESLYFAVDDERYRTAVDEAVQKQSDGHFCVINALILLERCDHSLPSVRAARELLFMYLGGETVIPQEKKDSILYLFRQIRDITYLQSDLPCAAVPMRIMSDSQSIASLLRQLFSLYNNASVALQMISALKKLLDDALYCDPAVVIRNEVIIRKMIRSAEGEAHQQQDWESLILSADSAFNRTYTSIRFPTDGVCLKLTCPDRAAAEQLEKKIRRIRGCFVAAYSRAHGITTLLVGLSKKHSGKAAAAFRVLKLVANESGKTAREDSPHLLLAAKFFLHYLLAESSVNINPYERHGECLFAARGHVRRTAELKKRIDCMRDNPDQKHEAEVILSYLCNDRKDDLCIVIPSSIVAGDPESGVQLAEFDGMLVYPNRADSQVVFFESKNRSFKPSRARRALIRKFTALAIPCEEGRIITKEKDAWCHYTVRRQNSGCPSVAHKTPADKRPE